MRLLLVCNPGGHFSTMMGLKEFWSVHYREWVTYQKFDTDRLRRQEIVHWVIMQEARMFGRAVINFFHALFIIYQSKPDLVVSTGASLAVPFIFASKLLGIRTVFVESITRATVLSLSGKLVYYVADDFYVQWPEFLESLPKAKYQGVVA